MITYSDILQMIGAPFVLGVVVFGIKALADFFYMKDEGFPLSDRKEAYLSYKTNSTKCALCWIALILLAISLYLKQNGVW